MKFQYMNTGEFAQINSMKRALAFLALLVCAFALTFLIIPFQDWKLHFYQIGIFGAGFVFGPAAGALVGALSSSYNALAILSNPWIIAGNALLGFFAAHFYKKYGPIKAALLAYAIQFPYVYVTDIYLMHMPVPAVAGILATLLATNIISSAAAGFLAPLILKKL